MNRTLLLTLLLFFLNHFHVSGQNPYFKASNISEIDFPTANTPVRSNNTSAYSFGDININGNLTDLFVFTWDQAQAGSIHDAGLAIRQTSPFGQSFNPPGFPVNDASSIEAVILQRGGGTYVLCTYYWINAQGFYVDLYRYMGNGVLQQQPNYPQNITAFAPQSSLGWIRLDAHRLNEFVITWEEHGQILAKAGSANSGFAMGNTAIIDNSSIGMDQAIQPDVALIRPQQSGGNLKAHFVYTNSTKDQLVASTLDFNTILSTPAPLASLSPVIEDVQQNADVTFELPRIDAPDDYSLDDWSYVVLKTDNSTEQGIIYTGVKNNAAGALFHFNLNDGSLGTTPLHDISDATTHGNAQPVVAYDNTGQNIYYCWNYSSMLDMPLPTAYSAYIGLKIDNYGNLTAPPMPLDQYWIAQLNPQYTSGAPSIALSGQNSISSGLFMAFTQSNNAIGYYMTSKTIPWAQPSFRPGASTGINASSNMGSMVNVYPNPFKDHFQLQSLNDEKGIYRLTLTNLMGQKLLTFKGSIKELNSYLRKTDLHNLSSGSYFLILKDLMTLHADYLHLSKIQ